MRKAGFFIAALVMVSGLVILLLSLADTEKNSKSGVKVAASFYPLAHFAQKAGGDELDVLMITPPGADSHDFEPTPRDIRRIRKAALFVYNGAGLDPWAEKIEPDLREAGVRTLGMASQFSLLGAKEDKHGHKGERDPHIWLDPVMASRQTQLIGEALAAADPDRASFYRSAAGKYAEELAGLDEEFHAGLSKCQTRDLVVAHGAFAYLAKRYGLNAIAITGVFSGEEPSPRRLKEVTDIVREKSIRYIFFEPLASPKVAETIARETGAVVLELNPLEGLTKAQMAAGEDYISIMRSNLRNLRKALQCT